MRIGLNNKWFLPAALVLVVCLLLMAGIVFYAAHLRNSTKALIDSATRIRSTEDAEREISVWRHQYSRGYSESRSPDGAGRAYAVEMGNGLLSKLRLVPNTWVLLQVVTVSGNLREVLLGVYTDKSSVWVQKEFSLTDSAMDSEVRYQGERSGAPSRALVMLGPTIGEVATRSAFAFNSNCLVKIGGCSNAHEILPSIVQVESAIQSGNAGSRH